MPYLFGSLSLLAAVGGVIAVTYEFFMRGRLKHQRLCDCFEGKLFAGS